MLISKNVWNVFKKVFLSFRKKHVSIGTSRFLTQDVQRCRGRLNCFLNDSAPFLCCSFSPCPQTRNKCWKMLQDIVLRCWTQQKTCPKTAGKQNSGNAMQWCEVYLKMGHPWILWLMLYFSSELDSNWTGIAGSGTVRQAHLIIQYKFLSLQKNAIFHG